MKANWIVLWLRICVQSITSEDKIFRLDFFSQNFFFFWIYVVVFSVLFLYKPFKAISKDIKNLLQIYGLVNGSLPYKEPNNKTAKSWHFSTSYYNVLFYTIYPSREVKWLVKCQDAQKKCLGLLERAWRKKLMFFKIILKSW